MDHSWHFLKFFILIEIEIAMIGIPFNLQTLLFFTEWSIGWIGHLLVTHGCRVLQINKSNFHQKYFYYLEYFQEENSLLGCHLVFSYWNIELKKLFLKNFSSHWNLHVLRLTVSKTSVMSVIFLFLWTLKFINFFFHFHKERSFR